MHYKKKRIHFSFPAALSFTAALAMSSFLSFSSQAETAVEEESARTNNGYMSKSDLNFAMRIEREVNRCFESSNPVVKGWDNGIEIIVKYRGRVFIRQEDSGVSAQVLTTGQDPYSEMAELLRSQPDLKDYCSHLLRKRNFTPENLSSTLSEVFTEARNLQTPLDIEEEIVIHAAITELVVRLSNVSLSASWSGCDESTTASWVNSILNRLDGTLSPCP